MPGGRGVEDDMVELSGGCLVSEQFRELVEGGDLDRARPRELLLHALDGNGRQHTPVGAHHTLAVVVRRLHRVDVERGESRDGRHGCKRGGEFDPQDLVEVRGRVGADEQDALPRIREADRCRTSRGRLAHAALAGEEEDACWILDERGHAVSFQQQPLFFAGSALDGDGPQQPLDVALGAASTLPGSPAHAASSSRDG